MVKYFAAASASWRDFDPMIAGTKEKRLTSKPTHRTSQSLAESLISVPIIAVIIKFIMGG